MDMTLPPEIATRKRRALRGASVLLALVLAACAPRAPEAERIARDTAPAGARPAASAPPRAPMGLLGPDSVAVRARVDAVFARFHRPGSPGCVVAVMNAGTIVYSRGYGSADVARRAPFTPASAFDAASMVKQFLAFGVALLVQEGKVSLDDPVRKHLPELPDYGAPVTLRHLVHHTSGLRDYDVQWLSGERITDPSRLRGLSFPPGTRHIYDDTGYDLLQRVIERVSGLPWATFARRRIFDPLGMAHTGLPPADAGLPRRVRGYAPATGGGFRLHESGRDGGFTTTPVDLARWDRNFYDPRVGGPAVARLMEEEGRLSSGETIPYALALHTESYRGLRRRWHGGLAAGYRSQFMRYPDQRTSVLVMCNVFQLAEPTSLAERVTDIVLADAIAGAGVPQPREVPPPPPAQLARLAGTYVNEREQALRPIRVHDGRLQMRQWITWHETRPLGGGRFRVDGQPLTLRFRDGVGTAPRTVEEHWDGRRTPEVLTLPPETRPTPAELERYAGSYRSDELGLTWRLRSESGELRVSGGPRNGLRLRPAGPDAFTDGEYVLVLFQRNASGRPAGLVVATPRVRELRFTRVA